MSFNKNIEKLWYRTITDQISPEEKERLNQWLRESPENKNIYNKFMKTWNELPKPNKFFQANVNREWNQFEKAVFQSKPSYQGKIFSIRISPILKKFLQPGWRPVTIGSVALITALCVLMLQKGILKSPYQTILTGNRQTVEVVLSDGSQVRLNAGSTLKFPKRFFQEERKVKLTGEAYFDVKPNTKPFVVSTKQAQTTVLGTEFNIWSRGDETRVMVKKGIVQLSLKSSDQNYVQIKTGQMSRVTMRQGPEKPIPINSDLLLGWLDGRLVFEKTPLKEAIAEIERYYDVSIKLDEHLVTRLLTAQFKDQSVDNVLKKICLAFNAEYQFESGIYRIQSIGE